MARGDHLAAAAEAGIITPAQARELDHFIGAREGGDDDPLGDAEAVRFARGFHDVFLTIGLVILLIGVVFSAGIVIGTLAGYLGAGVAWLLAEYYTRSRRLVLPSIALAAGFVLMIAVASGMLVESIINDSSPDGAERLAWAPLAGALAGLAAASGFRARFSLPFASGMVAATASATLIGLATVAAPDSVEILLRPLIFIAGATCFAAAMIYDLSDPQRSTLRADNAFWLHLAAAPLIVHSVVGAIAGEEIEITLGQAAAILGVLAVLALVALIIDRRAMLVAGLAYLGVAIGVLVREAQVDTGSVFAITLLFLGAAVVALGTGWQSARRAVVETLIPARMAQRLPTIRANAHE
jgi:hypothetical protein